MSGNEQTKRMNIEKPVLSKNDQIAAANRDRLARKGLYTINLIGSPGSGKTTLLEAMAGKLGPAMAVIEGDLQTERDAERVRAAGCPAVQIETGGSCHLDAERVSAAMDRLELEALEARLLVIENVGNLVCPSSYDLGEHMKVALLSIPEGDDKVLKYPSIFRRVGALAITKIDLLPHMAFDVERAVAECKSLNEGFECFRLSAKSGEGVDALCDELLARQSALKA
jgi:hydrogenase nickel incorporation protein HypB